jgi:hypothetical protein
VRQNKWIRYFWFQLKPEIPYLHEAVRQDSTAVVIDRQPAFERRHSALHTFRTVANTA